MYMNIIKSIHKHQAHTPQRFISYGLAFESVYANARAYVVHWSVSYVKTIILAIN